MNIPDNEIESLLDERAKQDAAQGPSAIRLLLNAAVALCVLGLLVYLLKVNFGHQLESFGKVFIEKFGLWGIFCGVFFSDAFTFPIPPQFYFLTAIASGTPFLSSFAAACVASILAANVGYHLAQRLSKYGWFLRFLMRSKPKVDQLFARFGVWAVVVAAISPLPFSMMCYFSGFYRMSPKLFALLCVFRIPRLAVLYGLMILGWS